MITCILSDKKYTVPFVTGRVLREIDDALDVYQKIVGVSMKVQKGEELQKSDEFSLADGMDTMVQWFCLLFGNQFTPDDVYDGYPVDSLMHDIAFAIQAVNAQMTEVLSTFPMKATTAPTKTAKKKS